MGIHIRHRLTSHGFSINVTPEPLAWFDLIEACGLPSSISATSLSSFPSSSAHTRTVGSVQHDLIDRFGRSFGPAGQGAVELCRTGEDGLGGEVGALVRALEDEVDRERVVCRSSPPTPSPPYDSHT